MDKQARRDKRVKNLSYKTRKPEKNLPNKPKDAKDIEDKRSKLKPAEVLPNNWSKYEIQESDEPLEGANFETLLQEPICNTHFKFKSEQNWDADIRSQTAVNEHFTLNLKLLELGLSTIPFPKLANLDENLFNHLELDLYKKQSESNREKYEKLLEKKFPPKDDIIIEDYVNEKPQENMNILEITKESEVKCNDLKSKIDTTIEQNNILIKSVEIDENSKKQKETVPEDIEDVEELLHLKSSQVIMDEPKIKAEKPFLNSCKQQNSPTSVAQQPTVDLEQWLDDILDD